MKKSDRIRAAMLAVIESDHTSEDKLDILGDLHTELIVAKCCEEAAEKLGEKNAEQG